MEHLLACAAAPCLPQPTELFVARFWWQVKYTEHVANGGCSSNKDDKIEDRLARLNQLLVAAGEYKPGSITGMGAADFDDEDEDASSAAVGAAHNLHVARSFLTEAALYSSVEEGGSAVPGVRLLTIHAAKGLEFEAVFLAGACSCAVQLCLVWLPGCSPVCTPRLATYCSMAGSRLLHLKAPSPGPPTPLRLPSNCPL